MNSYLEMDSTAVPNCKDSIERSRARAFSLAVKQRVSALRPVARSVDHPSAVVG